MKAGGHFKWCLSRTAWEEGAGTGRFSEPLTEALFPSCAEDPPPPVPAAEETSNSIYHPRLKGGPLFQTLTPNRLATLRQGVRLGTAPAATKMSNSTTPD